MKIIKYPDPILEQVSEEVKQEELSTILSYIPEMQKLMYAVKGVGLAAVQVGILKRFCIMLSKTSDLGYAQDGVDLIINPEIIEVSSETTKDNEGCLSLPLFWEQIERPIEVVAKFIDKDWIERTGVFYGISARCILHEISHMNGILIYKNTSPMKQDMWKKKLKKKGVT